MSALIDLINATPPETITGLSLVHPECWAGRPLSAWSEPLLRHDSSFFSMSRGIPRLPGDPAWIGQRIAIVEISPACTFGKFRWSLHPWLQRGLDGFADTLDEAMVAADRVVWLTVLSPALRGAA